MEDDAGQEGGDPNQQPTEGPAWQNETAAVMQEEMAEKTSGQNQSGQSSGQDKTGAVQHMPGGLHASDNADVSATPQCPQRNASTPTEHRDSRITGGTLCHRGQCPWQVMSTPGCLLCNWVHLEQLSAMVAEVGSVGQQKFEQTPRIYFSNCIFDPCVSLVAVCMFSAFSATAAGSSALVHFVSVCLWGWMLSEMAVCISSLCAQVRFLS